MWYGSSLTRRTFISTSAALGTVAILSPPLAAAEGDAVNAFTVNVPEADLAELRRRIVATRWPDRETVLRFIARRPARYTAGPGAAIGARSTTGEGARQSSTRCRSL